MFSRFHIDRQPFFENVLPKKSVIMPNMYTIRHYSLHNYNTFARDCQYKPPINCAIFCTIFIVYSYLRAIIKVKIGNFTIYAVFCGQRLYARSPAFRVCRARICFIYIVCRREKLQPFLFDFSQLLCYNRHKTNIAEVVYESL